jgi:hypothetical protein
MLGEPIPFFTDHNVPESVADYLESVGHIVTKLRNVMPSDTKDPVIAVACTKGGQVLVTHDTDFKAIAKRLKITKRAAREHLHRIQLGCYEPDGAKRMAEAMSLIESEWLLATASDRALSILIRDTSIRTER